MIFDVEPKFVWLDLEMTGLNLESDVILEIGVVITGPALHPLAEFERVVHYPDEVLNRMSDRVRRMHTENGLIEDVRASKFSLAAVEREALKFVAERCPPGHAMLCGSSVHQDRRFMLKYMRRLEQHLHFHQVDIATLGALANAWFPERHLEETIIRPVARHRAMADVRSSLEELRFYCRSAFGVDLNGLRANEEAQ